MFCFLKFVCNNVLSLMHANECSFVVCSAFVHELVIDFCVCVFFCDIFTSEGVWGHFFIDFTCVGRPWSVGLASGQLKTTTQYHILGEIAPKFVALGSSMSFLGALGKHLCDPECHHGDQK